MFRDSTRASALRAARPLLAQQGDSGTRAQAQRANLPHHLPEFAATVREITESCAGLMAVDPDRIVSEFNDAWAASHGREPEDRAIGVAVALIGEEPEYSLVAARLLAGRIDRQVRGFGIESFSQSIRHASDAGLVNDRVRTFVLAHGGELDAAIDPARTGALEYRGLQTLVDLYLLKDPQSLLAVETSQYFWMRIAVSMSRSVADAVHLYQLFSMLDYVPSAPMLSNAGTPHEQLCSCFLLDSSRLSGESIERGREEIAELSKYSGDIGVTWHEPRSSRSHVQSQLSDAGAGGADAAAEGRKGAACLYLEPWHAEIETFLEPQFDPGDAGAMRQLNLANWIPDLFMRRVEQDESWSLFDPRDVPELPDLFGGEFDEAYRKAESNGLARKVIPARDLYARMIRSIAHTGNGRMTFKDKANLACNQTGGRGNIVHLSSLCTEILEVTQPGDTAVCNLGSINLARHVSSSGFDFQKLANTVRSAVRQLDRVIDLNAYPLSGARDANRRWRPVGLGVMGLQDVFFSLGLPFDGYEARELSTRISETIYFHALQNSMEMARESAPHDGFADTRAARGELQFDAWGVTPSSGFRWQQLRDDIKAHGLRNSLLIAIAPTASIAAIAGCHECIEPQQSNLADRSTPHGHYVEFNPHLVAELKQLGLWNQRVRNSIVLADGSLQGVFEIPEHLRTVFRTVWELSTLALIDLAADRGAFVDQSQSLNLFMSDPNVAQLSNMYMYAWKCGLKTTYSLRSRWPRAMFDEEQVALTVTVLPKLAPHATAS